MLMGFLTTTLFGQKEKSIERDVVAYWRFDGGEAMRNLNNQIDVEPATSEVIKDVSGNGNVLRTFNTDVSRWPSDTSPTTSAVVPTMRLRGGEKNDLSLHFSGNQDVFTQSGMIERVKLDAFTVEAAVRVVSIGEDSVEYQVVLGKDGQPIKGMGNAPLQLTIAGRTDEFTVKDAPAFQIIDRAGQFHNAASKKPLPRDKWVWLAGVCDGNVLKLYVDRGNGYKVEGTAMGVSGGLHADAGRWVIGRGMYNKGVGQWLRQGWIDEVRVTARALSVREFVGYKRKSGPRHVDESQTHVMSKTIKPIELVKDIADPCLIKDGDTFYMYGTGEPDGFAAYSSKDLKTWKKHPNVLKKGDGVWGTHFFWAPSVSKFNGGYEMFYTSKGPVPNGAGRESLRICRAVSDSPLGPFKEVSSAVKDPLVNIGMATIDAEVFVDDDGHRYMYYVLDYLETGKSRILAAALDDDGRVMGESSYCFEPNLPWEGGHWVEAPSVIKHDGWYIMLYSANPFFSENYAIAYAVSKSPLGPWVKPPGNRILGKEIGMPGPGHQGILKHSEGLYYFPFHALIGPNARRGTFMVGMTLEATGDVYGYRPVFVDVPGIE